MTTRTLPKPLQATALPVAYGLRAHVVAGGLLSYASDLVANYRYVAKWVDKICKGEPLDDEHAEFVAGMEAVKAAETVPDKMRAFADMLEKRAAAPETREASAVRDAMRNRGKYTA